MNQFKRTLAAMVATTMLAACDSSTSSQDDALKAERATLVAEGNAVVAEMEAANRDHDFSRVREIRERKADYERRNAEWQKKASLAGWK
jgi:hypothetical protein